MILQPHQPSTPSKHHWGQSWNNIYIIVFTRSMYILHLEKSPVTFSPCHVWTTKQCVYPCHYVGCTIVERRKVYQLNWVNIFSIFLQNNTFFCNSKMVLKFIVGLTILELLIKKWTKILFWTIQLYLKQLPKTAWPTGNSYDIFGFPGLYF